MYDRYVKETLPGIPEDYATWEQYDHEFLSTTPWTIEENPLMECWLQDCSPALDIIAEAVQKPAFMFPRVPRGDGVFVFVSMEMPDVLAARLYAYGLRARANYRIAQEDFDGAFDDIIACLRLGRHVGHLGTTVHAVVGFDVETRPKGIDFNFPDGEQPSAEQLLRLLDAIDNLPSRVKLETFYEMERFMGLESIQSLMRCRTNPAAMQGGWECLIGSPATGFHLVLYWTGIDWNTIFTRINRMYDGRLDGTLDTDDYLTEDSGPQKYLTLKTRSKRISQILEVLLSPDVDAIKEAIWRTECTTNLKRLTLATLIYEKEHGTWPDSHPLHSWRVLLLPYLGEEAKELYEKIRLDEPWDSEHNRQFHEISLSAFQCPSANHQKMVDGGTHYSVIVRDDPEVGLDKKNRFLIVERQEAICWMKPDEEITQQAAEAGINKSPKGLGSHHPGGLNAAAKAGGVQFISDTIDDDKLQEWIVGTDSSR